MRAFLAAASMFIAARAEAALPAQVKRGDLEVRVAVTGTVVPEDLIRLKATIEGRVENVLASTAVWRKAGQPLAFLASRELAAMLDAKGAQDAGAIEDRWGSLYRPTPVRCPDACFVLKSFAKAKSWVKPQDPLFEAARSLKMVARVRPEDAFRIRNGQELVFWPAKNPKDRRRRRVERFMLDKHDANTPPGGSFTLSLSPDDYLEPGADWEGEIVPLSKKNVLIVPTAALIRHGNDVYLPIRVSTGLTTQALTQLTGGVEERRDFLILADSQLNGAERHKQEVDLEALRRSELEQSRDPKEDPASGEDGSPEARAKPTPADENKESGADADVIEGPDYGEDPYAEP